MRRLQMAIESGGSTPSWFRNERANALPDSKGDKKLRFNLFDMLEIKDVDKTMDIANRFLIAAATDDVEEGSDAKKTAKLPGRGAVRVGTEGTEDEPVYKYAFLNLNSLAKRLHVTTKVIKEQEGKGTLDIFIIGQIKDLAGQQKEMTKLLTAGAKGEGELVFGVKKAPKEGILGEGVPKEGILGEGVPEEGPINEGVRKPVEFKEEELSTEEGNRALFSDFIQKNFSDDEYLVNNLESFLDRAAEKEATTPYLQHLTSKLWWNAGLSKDLKVPPLGTVAITSSSPERLKIDLGASIFHGKAASRPDNDGKREVMRVNMVEWDKDNRYAIA